MQDIITLSSSPAKNHAFTQDSNTDYNIVIIREYNAEGYENHYILHKGDKFSISDFITKANDTLVKKALDILSKAL